jgi:WD40 repeat protein
MDKENKDSEALDKEIYELQNKLADLKKGFEYTIHDFSRDISTSNIVKKEKEAMKRLNFNVSKIITPPESTKKTASDSNNPLKFTNLFWAGDNNAYCNQFVATTNKGQAYVFNSENKKCLHEFNLSGVLNTCAIELSENGMIAVGGFDGGIYVKNINNTTDRKEEDNAAKKFTGHQGVVSSVRFLNTFFMISASFDSVMLLWDINSQGKFVSSYHDHSSEVSGLDVNEVNGNIFATGSGDTTVKLWDVREKKACVATFRGSDSSVNCVKFLPGRLSTLAAGSEDSIIRLYDLRALKELAVYKKTSGYNSINSIGFSKCGQILFATSNDSCTVNFWNLFDDGTPCNDFTYVSFKTIKFKHIFLLMYKNK